MTPHVDAVSYFTCTSYLQQACSRSVASASNSTRSNELQVSVPAIDPLSPLLLQSLIEE